MSRRCKNCVFWAPAGRQHTCVARYAVVKTPEGDDRTIVSRRHAFSNIDADTKISFVQQTLPIEHNGKATKPNFSCDAFHANPPPRLSAKRS